MKITILSRLPTMNWMLRSIYHIGPIVFWGLYDAQKNVVCKEVVNRYEPIRNYPVHLHFDWCRKDRKTDPDNIASAKKIVIDGLIQAGILEGDGWAHVCGLSDAFHIDKGNPRVVVTITHSPAPGRWVWQEVSA